MADMTREQAVEVLLEMRSAMLSCYASADDAQLGRDALDVAITALTAMGGQGEAAELLRGMGLDPERFRTEGGRLNPAKVRAAIRHPESYAGLYLPREHDFGHSAKFGGEICSLCGAAKGTTRAGQPCADHPAPQQPADKAVAGACQYRHEVVVAGRSAATSSGIGCLSTGGRCVPGSCADCPAPDQPGEKVRGLVDSQLLDFIASEYLSVQPFDMPTGQGDADIGWQVVEPGGRILAEVFHDDLRAALQAALSAKGENEDTTHER